MTTTMKTGTLGTTMTVHYLKPRNYQGKVALAPACTNSRNLLTWGYETGQEVTCKKCLKMASNPANKGFGTKAESDARHAAEWAKMYPGTLPPTEAQIAASLKETSRAGEAAQKRAWAWHDRNGCGQ